MRTYSPGQIYSFEVIGIKEINEKKYIYLSDGYKDTYRVTPYDYQLEWEPFHLPVTINCYVAKVNEFGLPLLAQVKKEVLSHNYTEEGTEYAFKLVAIRQDPNTNVDYYELHDMFGIIHRYYPRKGEPKRELGDIFSLLFLGIEDRGQNRANLKLAPVEELQEIIVSPVEDPRAESFLGTENESKEFKSTIVYPAGSIEPDIDRQMVIICKTIAGFMNQAGGELYIGVNDSGMVSGIEHDFQFINSSQSDPYTYHLNNDGYENKIRTTVKNLLGNIANANIKIEFLSDETRTYCKISIQEVLKPVFLNQSKLYQRAGNMTQLLKGDEIAWFIEERYRKRIALEGVVVPQKQHESIEEIQETEEVTSPERILEHTVINLPRTEEKIWYWMTFYDSGEWSFDQQPDRQSKDVKYHLAIPVSMKKERLIMAYSNGCVNVVVPYDQIMPKGKSKRKLRKKGERYKNGWNKDAEILKFFCANERDLLIFKSRQEDGTEWVKIHHAKAISVHGSLHLMGNVLINPKFHASIQSIDAISLDHYHLISALILKDHQTSGYLGYRSNDKSLEKVFAVLEKLNKY